MTSFQKIILSISLSLMPLASAKADYTLQFKGGEFPADVTTVNQSGFAPDAAGYRRGWTTDGWTVDRFGSRGYVALCPTFGDGSIRPKSMLALPPMSISESDVLSWEAISVMPERLESYRVIAIDSDSHEQSVLFETLHEFEEWTPRAISLKKLAGKSVSLAFVCNSSEGYMLALSNVKVISTSNPNLQLSYNTPVRLFGQADFNDRTHGTDFINIPYIIKNVGASANGISVRCLCDGKVVHSFDAPFWETGELFGLAFDVPAAVNSVSKYTLEWEDAEGNVTTLLESDFYTSHFRRNMLVDEGTGMWCVNCTEGILNLNTFTSQYPANTISVTTHYNDCLANNSYFSGLNFRSLPHFMLNRIEDSVGDNLNNFSDFIYSPTQFEIFFCKLNSMGDHIEAGVQVVTADYIPNFDNRYRIGYALVADFHDPESQLFYQRNNLSTPAAKAFYYLPTTIPAPLAYFHNVTLSGYEDAFVGIQGSLPDEMKIATPYYYDWTIPVPSLENCPNLPINFSDTKVVAYVLDAVTGEILNAEICPVDGISGGIEAPCSEPVAPANSSFFNLQGIPMGSDFNALPPGIYIRNGKKYLK